MVMENPSVINDLKEKIQRICLELSRYGEDTLVISVNVKSKDSSYYGSDIGCRFINYNKELVHQFLSFSLECSCDSMIKRNGPTEFSSIYKHTSVNRLGDYNGQGNTHVGSDGNTAVEITVPIVSNLDPVDSVENSTVTDTQTELNGLPSQQNSSILLESVPVSQNSLPLEQSVSPLMNTFTLLPNSLPLEQSAFPLPENSHSLPLNHEDKTKLMNENEIAAVDTVIIMTDNSSHFSSISGSNILYWDNSNFCNSYKQKISKNGSVSKYLGQDIENIGTDLCTENLSRGIAKSVKDDHTDCSLVSNFGSRDRDENISSKDEEDCVQYGKQLDNKNVAISCQKEQNGEIIHQSSTEPFVKIPKRRSFIKETEFVDVFSKQPYKCSVCGVRFTCVKNLYNHKKRMHAPGTVNYKCDKCGTRYNSQKSLNNHNVLHSIVEGDVDNKVRCNRNGIIQGKHQNICNSTQDTYDKTEVISKTILSSQNRDDENCDNQSKQVDDQDGQCPAKDNIQDSKTNQVSSKSCNNSEYLRNVSTSSTLEIVAIKDMDSENCEKEIDVHTNNRIRTRNMRSKTKHKSESVSSEQELKLSNNGSGFTVKKEKSSSLKLNRVKSETSGCKCHVCQKTFAKIKTLKEHLKKVHGISYKCTECSLTFQSAEFLKEHKKINCKNKGLQCDMCNKIFAKRYNMQRHMLMVHMEERMFKCEVCKKEFKTKHGLKRHLTTHQNPHKCDTCGLEFLQYVKLVSHKASAHKKDKKRFSCSICCKIYGTRQHVTIHMRNHTGERPFECLVCKKRFRAKETLKIHQNTHYRTRTHLCDICGRVFTSKTSLIIHRKCHGNNNNWKCKFCDKLLTSKQGLQSHMVTYHFNECNKDARKTSHYQCEICGKMFVEKNRYNVHKFVHTGEKPYCCDICGCAFNHPSNLSAHRETHNRIRSFSCKVCLKTFLYKRDLSRHTKTCCPAKKHNMGIVQPSVVSNTILLQF